MKIRKRDLFTGTTEDLIEYFENKYPLKSNKTSPRKEGEFYFYDAEDKNSIRNQIENSKYPTGCVFASRVTEGEFGQALHIEVDWFSKTDIK